MPSPEKAGQVPGEERINHGSIWLDKHTGYTVGVLSICGHPHDCDNDHAPIVSGHWHRGPSGVDANAFAFPEPEFRGRFLLLAEDPEVLRDLLLQELKSEAVTDWINFEDDGPITDGKHWASAIDLAFQFLSQPVQEEECDTCADSGVVDYMDCAPFPCPDCTTSPGGEDA